MSNVFRPILPPKYGYVEVLDADGNHIYKATEETQKKLEQDELIAELEKENKRLKAQATLMDEQFEFLSDCLIEMADVVYAE